MIAIDTNVLLRYLLQDDKEQAILANKLLTAREQILLTDIVLIETIWTLKGKKYKLQKDEIVWVIERLFKETNLYFENSQAVWMALNSYRSTEAVKVGGKKKDSDFADILILEKAKYHCGAQNLPFDGLYSFDVAAQQVKGIKNP